MTQSKYQKLNLTRLREKARKAGIDADADWKKADFVAALVAHDKENAPAEEMSDLPPPAEAPDENATFEPPTDPPVAPAPPPDPPKPQDEADIPPDRMPRKAKRYKLMNDIKWQNAAGMPVLLKAGRIMADNQYDIKGMKAKGAVLVEERVFEARKAAKE